MIQAPLAAVAFLIATVCVMPARADPADTAIQTALRETGVPGAVLTVVRGCKIQSTRAWGVESVLTQTPMTAETRLQAASIGKPVAAFAILQLATEGPAAIDLNRPLSRGEAVRFHVDPPERAQQLTIAHLLSHRSSLGNSPFPGPRHLSAEPGAQFRYSGVGYQLAQKIVEERTGQSIEEIARRTVFAPAQMGASSYVDRQGVAAGHMRIGLILANGGAPAGAIGLFALIVALIWRRVRTKSWGLGAGEILFAGLGACAGVGLLFGLLMGPSSLWTIVPLFLAMALVGAGAAYLLERFSLRWPFTLLAALAAIFVSALAIAPLSAPIRTSLGGHGGNIAYSLVSTAPDLARFAIAVMRPTSPAREQAARLLTTPVGPVSPDVGWGLGLGVRATPTGPIAWQWGGNPGYSGLLVMSPARCDAIVLLTNGDKGADVGRAAVKALWGLDVNWRI